MYISVHALIRANNDVHTFNTCTAYTKRMFRLFHSPITAMSTLSSFVSVKMLPGTYECLDFSFTSVNYFLSNCYTMVYPPLQGDNPRALARKLSTVQVENHDLAFLYHLRQCRPYRLWDI